MRAEFWADGLVCWRNSKGDPCCNVVQRFVHHSPTGFEWGYPGSGPADLALNVLALLLPVGDGESAPLWDGQRVSDAAWALHQRFKERFLCPMPYKGGMIPQRDMVRWIALEIVSEGTLQ